MEEVAAAAAVEEYEAHPLPSGRDRASRLGRLRHERQGDPKQVGGQIPRRPRYTHCWSNPVSAARMLGQRTCQLSVCAREPSRCRRAGAGRHAEVEEPCRRRCCRVLLRSKRGRRRRVLPEQASGELPHADRRDSWDATCGSARSRNPKRRRGGLTCRPWRSPAASRETACCRGWHRR